MNVKFPVVFIVAVCLTIITYFSFSALSSAVNPQLAASISVLVAAILTPVISHQFSNANESSVTSDEDNVTTLYVGNLPYRANEEAVKAYFQDHTKVQSVRLMKDKRTGKRKGYGFVEVISSDVTKAIEQLNDSVFQDRTLKVRYAKDKVAH